VHRALGDHELLGDRGVAQPLGHQREHVAFARAQPAERVVGPATGQQQPDHLGVDGRAPAGHPVQRLEELLDPAHPLLEQVAQPRGATGQQVGGEGLLDVRREHEHGQAGQPPPGLDGGDDALVGMRGRHPHVDDGHVGLVLVDGGQERGRAVGGRHHVERLGPQQQRQALAQQRVVLGDHDPHGSSTRRVVGPPAGLVRVMRPS